MGQYAADPLTLSSRKRRYNQTRRERESEKGRKREREIRWRREGTAEKVEQQKFEFKSRMGYVSGLVSPLPVGHCAFAGMFFPSADGMANI